MRLIRKIRTFIRLPRILQWLFIKALFISAIVRFTLSFLSFKRVASWLGKANQVAIPTGGLSASNYCRYVGIALLLCHKYSFWPTECYTQSLTAKILLRQKKINSTLYIGFYKNKDGRYKGHAWLQAEGIILTGNSNIEQYQLHSFFS